VSDDDSLPEKLAYWRKRGAPGRLSRKGTTDTRPVTNELTGGTAGFQRHHWDGRVDARVTPDTKRIRVTEGA
jgi:hypothetical protein